MAKGSGSIRGLRRGSVFTFNRMPNDRQLVTRVTSGGVVTRNISARPGTFAASGEFFTPRATLEQFPITIER